MVTQLVNENIEQQMTAGAIHRETKHATRKKPQQVIRSVKKINDYFRTVEGKL
jgi:DNA-binding protein Fis